MMSRHALLGAALAVGLLAGCGANKEFTLDSAVQSLLPPSPQQRVAQLFDPDSPDRRRESIVACSKHDWGLQEKYLKAYGLLAADEEPSVRSAAVTALGRAGDPTYAPQVLRCLEDPVEQVRVDAALALGAIPGDEAAAGLRTHALKDAGADVRAACAQSLRNHPDKTACETLVACLRDQAFGVRYAARQSLTALTGIDCGYDTAAWRERLQGADEVSAVPAAGERPWWDWLGVTAGKGG